MSSSRPRFPAASAASAGASEWQRRRRLTLQIRLALLTGMLLGTLSLGLVLFINVAATVTTPNTQDIGLPWDVGLPPQPPQPLQPLQTPAQGDVNGANQGGRPESTPTPMPLPGRSPQILSASDTVRIRQEVLGRLQVISLVGLGLVVVVGALGAYWVARQALSPLREMSAAARHISTKTLGARLGVQAPEDEIKDLADAIDTMLDRLERAFDQQRHFVADAAHELRTPLATLRINLEVVHSDPDSTLDEYQEMSSVLERALTRLERLVSDLLIIAMAEKSPAWEEVALKHLLQNVIRDLRSMADKQDVGLRLMSEGDVLVRGDRELLARAFSNLIENGIRYNREGGVVTVTISQNQDKGQALVTVSDTGIGIPPESQEHIFDRFYRVDNSRSRHRGGAGLGLAITNHIVEMHRGSIYLESTPDVGSRFTVHLPL